VVSAGRTILAFAMNSQTWVRVVVAVIVVALFYNCVQTQRDLNQLRQRPFAFPWWRSRATATDSKTETSAASPPPRPRTDEPEGDQFSIAVN
jgi:hypothetical protein